MTSAMTRNQVMSFIVSVVICFLLILVGYPPVTDFLSNVVGLSQAGGSHRGVQRDDPL